MDDAEYDERKARMRKLSAAFAYPGANRIMFKYLLRVSQAVYTTPDELRQVDQWYCEKLDLGPGANDVGIAFNADGRRWSFFRDGIKYRNEPALKRGPATVRQLIGEALGARVIVLAHRLPDLPITQVSVTVLPADDPLAEAGAATDCGGITAPGNSNSRRRRGK